MTSAHHQVIRWIDVLCKRRTSSYSLREKRAKADSKIPLKERGTSSCRKRRARERWSWEIHQNRHCTFSVVILILFFTQHTARLFIHLCSTLTPANTGLCFLVFTTIIEPLSDFGTVQSGNYYSPLPASTPWLRVLIALIVREAERLTPDPPPPPHPHTRRHPHKDTHTLSI